MSEVPPGIVCSPEQYAQSLNDPLSLYCLSRGDAVGLTVSAAGGVISLMALLYVFRLIFINLLRPRSESQIFQKPMDLLMLALFIADSLQAIGGAVNIRWINIGFVEVGEFCTAQGIIQNVGETGVAFSTFWITTFTLYDLWKGRDPPMWTTFVCIGLSCFFLVLMVTLSNVLHPRLMTPTPFWCWISPNYFLLRLFAEYFWLWVALCWSILVYIMLYLFHRGTITVGDGWWPFRRRRVETDGAESIRSLSNEASTMLWYPLTYGFTILPLSINRWVGWVHPTPAAFAFFCVTIWNLSGFFNVILLVNTRPEAGLFGTPPTQAPLPDAGQLFRDNNPEPKLPNTRAPP